MKIMKLKRKVLETILKKIENGKASGEDNVPSELYKFKTTLLKFLSEIYLTADWSSVVVMPVIKKKLGKIQTTTKGLS